MKILLTGASGFLGSHIFNALHKDHDVTTIGRNKPTLSEDHLFVDFSSEKPGFKSKQFDVVIHAAGKAHVVPKTRKEKKEFFLVNAQGTRNLLAGLDDANIKPKGFVLISTVAVYGKESGQLIDENVSLMAQDPYGLIKIDAEKACLNWGRQNKRKITILRLPLVVGKNAPGNLGAMAAGIQSGKYFNIGDGDARRSMVLAEDVAHYVLEAALVGGIYNLTDGYHPNYFELSHKMAEIQGKEKVKSLPIWLAKRMANFGSFVQNTIRKKMPFNRRLFAKMTTPLTFQDMAARDAFDWQPKEVLQHLKDNL